MLGQRTYLFQENSWTEVYCSVLGVHCSPHWSQAGWSYQIESCFKKQTHSLTSISSKNRYPTNNLYNSNSSAQIFVAMLVVKQDGMQSWGCYVVREGAACYHGDYFVSTRAACCYGDSFCFHRGSLLLWGFILFPQGQPVTMGIHFVSTGAACCHGDDHRM